jgi:hypothetical protein
MPSELEWRILDLLLEARILGVAELVQAIGSPIAIADALETLHTARLIDRRRNLVILAAGYPDAINS